MAGVLRERWETKSRVFIVLTVTRFPFHCSLQLSHWTECPEALNFSLHLCHNFFRVNFQSLLITEALRGCRVVRELEIWRWRGGNYTFYVRIINQYPITTIIPHIITSLLTSSAGEPEFYNLKFGLSHSLLMASSASALHSASSTNLSESPPLLLPPSLRICA